MVSGHADAGKTTGGSPVWELPRSPFVPHRAAPSALECDLDEDDDGLDDEIEGLLAERFVPQLLFSLTEPARKDDVKFPGGKEPFTAFNAWPEAKNGALRVSIRYQMLFEADAGYYDHTAGQGTDPHEGDNQPITVVVELTANPDGRWIAELVGLEAGRQIWERDVPGTDDTTVSCGCDLTYVVYSECDCSPPKQVETLPLNLAGHPRVYSSWGKHHWYLNAPLKAQFSEGWGCIPLGCFLLWRSWDLVDGLGQWITPVLRMHYPKPTDPEVFTNVGDLRGPGTPIADDWGEKCQMRKHAYQQVCACDPGGEVSCPPPAPPGDCAILQQLVATCAVPPDPWDLKAFTPAGSCADRRFPGVPHGSKFIGDIGMLFLGESFLSDKRFCGGTLVCDSPTASLPGHSGRPGPKNLDTDGDTIFNFDDLCPTLGASFDHSDADGDGVGKACDPNPNYRDTWIGKGYATHNLRAYKPVPGVLEDPKRRGWLDTDEDTVTNGADFCPATAGGSADQLPNWNLWAEKSVFVSDTGNASYAAYDDDGKDLSPYRPKPVDTGFIERASLCDPYETTKLWQQPAYANLVTGDVCQQFTLFGAPKIQVDAVPLRGVSANDLAFSGKTYAQRLEEAKKHGAAVRVDPRRCACSAFDKNPAVREVVCFNEQTGECPRTSPLVNTTTDVILWFAQEYPNCARTTQPMFGGSRCLPFTTTAPVAASAFCPPGQPCPKVPGDLTPKVHHLGWDWITERATYPGHFRPEWFQTGKEALTGKEFSQATVGFTFATRTFLDGVIPGTPFPLDSDLFSPKAKTFDRSVGQHADVDPWIRSDDPTRSEAKLSAQDKLRRTGSLRTHFTESFAQPSEPHLGLNKNIPSECNKIYDTPQGQSVWLIPYNKCIPIEKCFDKLGQASVALVKSTVDPAAVKLVALGSGTTQAVQVVQPAGGLASLDCVISNCGPSEVGASWQLTALPGGAGDGGLPRLVATASGRARSDGIADDAGDRFWVLAPVGVEESVVAYSVVASGGAPIGTSRADAFLGADDGGHVIAFGEARSGAPAWLRLLDVETSSWTEVTLDPELPPRANAAYVLHEHGLYRAGGEAGAGLASDAVAIDWRSGRFETVVPAGQLPPRSGPLLTWDVQGEGILYGGGTGADGAAHDDLWSVRAGHGVAVRLVADTTPVLRPLDASRLVLATGFTGEAIWWDAPTHVAGLGVRHSLRRAELGGWVEADVVSKAAVARTCADGSPARRCASGADWWRTPSTRCASGSCELGRAEQATTGVLPGPSARDLALEHSTLWIARGTKLERWSLLEPGSAAPVASVNLGAPVTAIAARDGVVLAATAKQVARVGMVNGALQVLQSGIPVCRAESLTSIGLRGWLVATSDGAALLQPNDTGALAVASEVELAKVQGKWSATPPKKSGKQCTLPPSAGGAGEDLPSRVAFDGTNVELAHGNDVFRLSWDASGQLALLDVTSVTGKILDLRATSERAYLVGKHPHQKTDLGVVLLGQTMQLDGQHDVADWIRSEQSGAYRARITESGGVEVAWLVQ